MKRRTALALFAVSLSILSACSNSAETPSNTEVSKSSVTTEAQETPTSSNPPANTVNAETLKSRQDPRRTQDFLDAVQGNLFSYETLTQERNAAYLDFAQRVCVDFDNGKTFYDLVASEGFADDKIIDFEEQTTLEIAALAAYMICDEHMSLADAVTDILTGNFTGG